MIIRRLTALVAVSSWLVACSSAAEAEAKQSAGRVARAIEVLREAPNAGKSEALLALGKTACSGPEVCETRAACQAAYAEHVEALALIAVAKLKAAELPEEAAKLLGSAQTKLTAGEAGVMTCTEREQALRRRYKL